MQSEIEKVQKRREEKEAEKARMEEELVSTFHPFWGGRALAGHLDALGAHAAKPL